VTRAVREYVMRVDPANVSLVDTALAACEPDASVSSAVAPGRYKVCLKGQETIYSGAIE
jgi:erythromycin esterase